VQFTDHGGDRGSARARVWLASGAGNPVGMRQPRLATIGRRVWRQVLVQAIEALRWTCPTAR
jgi:hypothetical protein